jgi:ubiquinone/menaquinone biosynthesis C-methylase UbiE
MKRLNKENINTPEFFNEKFNGELAFCDIKRQELLVKYYNGGVFIDVGCMDNPMPSILAEKHEDIYALDFADKIIDILKAKYPKVKYQTIKDCTKLPFKDNSVDYITAGELIEHLEDPKQFVDECMRVLKKGGYLAISTPFEETISQGNIGGKQHIWAFDMQDIKDLFGDSESYLLKDSGGNSIIVWKRK